MIHHAVVPIAELGTILTSFLIERRARQGDRSLNQITAFVEVLNTTLWCYVEFPYVDKVYRDSFYHYYASKLDSYSRECMKVGFFSGQIAEEQFLSEAGHRELQSIFLGFAVIRPTAKGNPGRTLLSPLAFREHGFICEMVELTTSIGGVKLTACGFPYISQDTETMTCAESSIWSVMEYYGNRYPEQRPVLPSAIHKAFERPTRVLPSEGLQLPEIATALSKFGFGTCLYSKLNGREAHFRKLLRYYIESGIPVILGLHGDFAAHAVVSIGHEELTEEQTRAALTALSPNTLEGSGVEFIDSADIPRRLVQIDDNVPPYQLASFEDPCCYYGGSSTFAGVSITHFVVPLNRRIYLEARKADRLFNQILDSSEFGWDARAQGASQKFIRRIFITSGRSFKSVSLQSDMHNDIKTAIQTMEMPRFVWIAEISTTDLYCTGRAEGLILLDATGTDDLNSAKLVLYPGYFWAPHLRLELQVNLGCFIMYQNNLKGGWSQWTC